jgi:hypothetical protein
METLVPLVVGFVLTTVLGGLLGTYLQWRTWDHQNETRLREEELRRAGAVCQPVSGLLDDSTGWTAGWGSWTTPPTSSTSS